MLSSEYSILLIDDDADVLDAYTQLLNSQAIGFLPVTILLRRRRGYNQTGQVLC